MTKIFKEKERKREEFIRQHGYARPPMSTMMNDKRLVVIGGSIYIQTQEGPYTFMHALHDCALELFGVPYLEEQEQRPLVERHPALQWMYTYLDYRDRFSTQHQNEGRIPATGAGAAWFRFGYDIFTIRDNAMLHARLRERLLNVKDFQAARHELAVAAISVAAGFEIEFEDEADNTTKHAEFIGADKTAGLKIAVEAKSRRRRGVKGFDGGRDSPPGQTVGVRDLVLEGFKKASGVPCYLFVDVNLPAAPDDETYDRWQSEIDQTMRDLDAEGYLDKCPVNAVFFTNDPSHYVLTEEIGKPRDVLWFKHFVMSHPRVPHPSSNMVDRFFNAFNARIAPPRDFPDLD